MNYLFKAIRAALVSAGAVSVALTGLALANYNMTIPGSGTSFGSLVISSVHYAQMAGLPPAARTFTGCSVGTSSGTCFAASTAVTYLEIQNTSTNSNIACKPGGTAILNDSGGSFMLIPGQSKSWGINSGGVPTGAINCIASNASTPAYVEWN